ncbi:S9 family peptidase [Alteraurantiacibacter aquimixticola]|uniref:S9 family peptidase n=1 Tax=Alteraurantiacibacter aquimixticola TaxID=2489173 RepID=A0A4T3F0L6_9SPHN|nr:S9 family peptidase [Alteraurantiacibacter aquimixticola]TIX49732.1 S9 family peptidase [Alteraurantiacibacter aquimixticola]
MKSLRTALLAGAVLLPSAVMARPMTPEDVARIEYTGTVAVSEDGTRIAYTTFSRPDVTSGEENGSGSQQLFLADGPMQARAYLPEDVGVSGIGFSPDGTMITYLWADEDEKRGVWGVPVAGGAPRKLAGLEDANVLSYAIAPSGESIYLLAAAAPDEDRDDEADLGFNARIYEEEQHFNRLFVAASGTAEVDPEPREIDVPGHVDGMDLAPDGSWMVVTSAPSTLVDDSLVSRKPYIVNLVTGDVRVVDTPGKIDDIEIAPDGSQFSLIAGVDVNDPAATTLHLVDAATATYRALNEGAAEAVVDTEWMADGRLATIVHVGAQSVLRFYSDDGDMLREVDPEGLILTSIEHGGNRLVTEAHSPSHPNELFLFTGNTFQRWTDHNPWLAEIDFGTQTTVTFTARDGQAVEGILIEPVGGVDFGGAPTILDVHGGPEAHESNGWVTGYGNPGQVAAGRGYAVFLPNYRGSTAYGTAFSKQHQGNYTDPEFADLVDAKYALAELGYTDPARVGITGGSYGGYATAWSSTYNSEEFAAGVMFVGISNQISKMGTGDIPLEMYNVHARQWPWEDWTGMLEVSPIYYADRADTPLLILHGEEDTRVSPTQSVELYRHIKIRRPDTPLRLVFYPGEGHGNGMAAARYDYNVRMMEWFDTYLMTGDRDAPIPGPRPALELGEDEEGGED